MNPHDLRALEFILYRCRLGEIASLSLHLYPREGPTEFEWFGETQSLNVLVNAHLAQISSLVEEKSERTEDTSRFGSPGEGMH